MIDTHLHILPGVDDGPETITAQRSAGTLLNRGLVHCIASDVHRLGRRPPTVAQGLEQAVRVIGQVKTEQLIEGFPKMAMNDVPCTV